MAVGAVLAGTASEAVQGIQTTPTSTLSVRVSLDSEAVTFERDRVALSAAGRLGGQIAGLARGRANAGTAVSVLQVADTALSSISSKLSDMKTLATQAAASTSSAFDRAIINREFAALSAEVDTLAQEAKFGDLQLLVGSGGGDTLTLSFNVGGDPLAEDSITVTLQGAKAAQLASGLGTADLSTAAGASQAKTDVDAAIDKLDDARAAVRAATVSLAGASQGASQRATVAEAERADRLATRINIDFARFVGDESLDDRGVVPPLHDTQLMRHLFTALEAAAFRRTAPASKKAAPYAPKPATYAPKAAPYPTRPSSRAAPVKAYAARQVQNHFRKAV